jgi:hypothetical protein
MDQISTLATLVHGKLTAAKQHSPGSRIISDLLQVVYATSMKREESEPLRCNVVYLDPKTKPEGEVLSADTWNAFPLANPVPLDSRNLAKLCQSADPSAVVLAAFPDDKGKLFIWGFIDQIALHSLRMATWETWRSQSTPGDFHVVVNGVADITVYRGLGILAAMKQDVIVEKYDDVLNIGPVCKYLHGLSSPYTAQVESHFPGMPKNYSNGTLSMHLRIALSRILLSIQKYKHGGALLVTGDTKTNLSVKHGLVYDRLPGVLSNFSTQVLREDACNHYIHDHLLPKKKSISPKLFREYVRADFACRDCMSEMAGCVKFIGSLSRIDGLILMDRGLVVHGFGVEIVDVPEVASLFVAEDGNGKNLREIQANEFGTRHRSMFRYCNMHENSLGFVVSQDGLIRSIKKVGKQLIMWENVKAVLTVDENECTDKTCPHCRIEVEGGCESVKTSESLGFQA